MDFGLAIRALKQGRTVARAGWNGKGMWLELQRPDAHSKMTLPYVYLNYPEDAQNTPGARVPWLASQTDMLAEDWEIVGPTPAGINTDPAPYWQNEEPAPPPPPPTLDEVVSEAVSKLVEIAGNGTPWPEKPTDVLERVCVSRLNKLGIPIPTDLRQICNDALMRALMKG